MALSFNGTNITSVVFNGTEMNALNFDGQVVFQKAVPVWETIWTGSRTFSDSGSYDGFNISEGDELQVTATATFSEMYYDYDYGEEYPGEDHWKSITQKTLPTSIQCELGWIDISASGNKLRLSFNSSSEYAKGYELWEDPTSITIKEIRRRKS